MPPLTFTINSLKTPLSNAYLIDASKKVLLHEIETQGCICVHISECISEVYALELPTSQRRPLPLTVGRKVLLRKNPREGCLRTELCTLGWTNLPPVKCKISVNTHTVGDLADLQALLLDRKHFTCRFTGLPQRLYGSSREVTNIQTRGFPVMKVEPISRISRGGLILSTSPFRSQRSFTDFSMGFILAPSLFFGWKVAITWKSVVEEAWTPHRWRIVQSFNSERINPMCRPNYCPDIWKTAFSEIVGTKENLQLQSVAIK